MLVALTDRMHYRAVLNSQILAVEIDYDLPFLPDHQARHNQSDQNEDMRASGLPSDGRFTTHNL